MSGWWLASYLVLWALLAVLCVVVVALARQVGTLHLRLGPRGALELDGEGPALGSAPPPAPARTIDGRAVTIGGGIEPQLVLFVSPGCRVCEVVLPSLDVIARASGLTPLLVTDVDADESALAYRGSSMGVPIVPGVEVAQSYEVPGTPYVVVLDGAGIVRAKGTVNNLEQLEGLVDTAARRMNERIDAT